VTRPLRVLIGCETSGIGRRAFAALGHDVWSCDLEPAEDGKPVEDFPRYIVTNLGRTISLWHKRPKVLRPGVDAKGYQCVSLRSDDGRQYTARVHRLVASAFLIAPDNAECVRHIDGNPANNRASNLAWGTYRENEDDKRNHGTWDLRRNGKLSESDRVTIRELSNSGTSQKTIAAQFGVSRPTITRLVNGTIWGNDKC
jgi:hypothetical protein